MGFISRLKAAFSKTSGSKTVFQVAMDGGEIIGESLAIAAEKVGIRLADIPRNVEFVPLLGFISGASEAWAAHGGFAPDGELSINCALYAIRGTVPEDEVKEVFDLLPVMHSYEQPPGGWREGRELGGIFVRSTLNPGSATEDAAPLALMRLFHDFYAAYRRG